MNINMDYLNSLGKFVIHCDTEDKADDLFRILEKELPNKLIGWTSSYTHWDFYQDKTCYALHLENPARGMQFSSVNYWNKYGYSIIPFLDIFKPFDLGEVQKNGDFDVNFLYEIGV